MTNFPVHTIESAPERSKSALKQLQSAFGMIPNIAGAMATSPVLINCLVGLFGNVHGGSFTEAQVQTVLLTDAVTNASTWAVAFHTALADGLYVRRIDPFFQRKRRMERHGPSRGVRYRVREQNGLDLCFCEAAAMHVAEKPDEAVNENR